MKQIFTGNANAIGIPNRYRAYLLILCICFSIAACGGGSTTGSVSVSGFVRDGDDPVSGVTVTLQGADISTVTDAAGAFTLNVPAPFETARISAWKEGYYCGLLVDVTLPAQNVVVSIRRHLLIDYAAYEWLPPEGKYGCMACHPALTATSKQDAHMGSATNPRFLSAYYGQDVLGNQSPDTTYTTITTNWGILEVPEPYDATKPYYGPGWRIDFPTSTGTCTSCHIPGAATSGDVDPKSVAGADKYGVHCDFCHKIGYVHLEKNTGLPPLALPGVQNIDLFRPSPWFQLFMGSFADSNGTDEGVLSPFGGIDVTTLESKRNIYSESRYCASCHYGAFWGKPVYTSYQEWAQSPYADKTSAKYKTCQNCHMPSPTTYNGKVLTNIAPGKGGIERNPNALHSHNMTITAEMLQKSTLTMKASATDDIFSLSGNEITVNVTLTNDQTGHAIPTDSPWRQMILLVEARDQNGSLLALKSGSTLPSWCGVGDFASGYYAYMPGKAYAKVLKEMWTNVVPAVSYWRHTTMDSDTRLAALASDSTQYVFYAPGVGSTVTVKLIYRRAYIDMMAQKKWNSPDIIMAQQTFKL